MRASKQGSSDSPDQQDNTTSYCTIGLEFSWLGRNMGFKC